MLGFGKGNPLSRFKEGAQDAYTVPAASVEGNHREWGHSATRNTCVAAVCPHTLLANMINSL